VDAAGRYCYGLRSGRRLCDETHLNLAYRWLCLLGLEGAVPDHSTFSKNRHGRFRESAPFRRLFEKVVARMQARLVGGEGFAIDASVIEADANCGRKVDGKITTWPDTEKLTRPVREYLAALDRAAAAVPRELLPREREPLAIAPQDRSIDARVEPIRRRGT
jgi:hypothetical protein